MSTVDMNQHSLATDKPRDLSIDYLRTTITLMVIAHHSALAYTTWARFDSHDVFRSTAPVVDVSRWAFLDYAENFNDVFFMSLMFFVSGLFTLPAIRKHGAIGFARDRLLRLGVPFIFAVMFIIPLAYYAMWNLTDRHSGYWTYYAALASHGYTVGPPWFIWVLLLFDVCVATLLLPLQQPYQVFNRLAVFLRKVQPWAIWSTLLVLSGVAYLPLLKRYGFDRWTVLISSPFAFQEARICLYALWFLFGALVGAPGLESGMLSRSGGLARHWKRWLFACFCVYNALWFLPRTTPFHGLSSENQGTLEAMLWVASCVTSCFCFLAVFRALKWKPATWMLSLSRSAYVMYLVHYVYVAWEQRLLLPFAMPAAIKAVLVFCAATFLSWLTAQGALRLPSVAKII